MQFIRSLIFNIFLYVGLITIFVLAIPTLVLPSKFTIFFGRLSAKYIVLILRIILNTKVIFNGIENLKKLEIYFNHKLIFTNQNFSPELSNIFFKDLKIKKPDYIFNIPNKSVGQFYGDVLINCEKVFVKESPDAIVILGDTNSCISALVAGLALPFHS